MKALEDRIVAEGKVYAGGVLKVGSFLNQQIDIDFLMEMGKEISRLYEGSKITKVLTIESSGIAVATCVAAALHVPVIFAKKTVSSNIGNEVYTADIHSYTHGNDYTAVLSKEYLSADDFILIADDFLANGCAIEGLKDICDSAGATLVGAAIVIEKGFQKGGDELRKKGIRVESLAIVDEMTDDGKIVFRKQD